MREQADSIELPETWRRLGNAYPKNDRLTPPERDD